MQFNIRFYFEQSLHKPMVPFLHDLQRIDPILHKLVVAGIKKLEMSERHGPPLTEQVDSANAIFELRVGGTNIARVFFFFRTGQEIILTNGYVKKQMKIDTHELKKAQTYKRDWEGRFP